MNITFDQWLEAIDSLANLHGFEGSYTEQTGHDCWQTSFDLGESPEEAFAEELSHWHE